MLLAVDEGQPDIVCPGPYMETGGEEYILLTAAECDVRENVKYTVTVSAENKFNLISSSDKVYICKYMVQRTDIEIMDVCLTCSQRKSVSKI